MGWESQLLINRQQLAWEGWQRGKKKSCFAKKTTCAFTPVLFEGIIHFVCSSLHAAQQHRPRGQTQGSRKKGDAPRLEQVSKCEYEVCVPQNGVAQLVRGGGGAGLAAPGTLRTPGTSALTCSARGRHECLCAQASQEIPLGFLKAFCWKQTFSCRFSPWTALTWGGKTGTSPEPTPYLSRSGQKCATGLYLL